MHKVDIIYLDMDGVICDFEKRYEKLFKIKPSEVREAKNWNGFFDMFIAEGHFRSLEKMPDADVLLDFLSTITIPIEILSSTASQKRHDAIGVQKEDWLNKYSITYKRNFVPGKHLKYKYATPTAILIDDTGANINDWLVAGGIAIHHEDANSTISKLSEYLELTSTK